MIRILFVALLFLCFSYVFCQDAESYEEKADMKYEERDYQYAMVLIDKAIALNDTSYWLLLKKSNIELHISGPRKAMTVVEKAIALKPEASESYNYLGLYFESLGIIDTSIMMFDKAIGYAENDTIRFSFILNRGGAKSSIRDFLGAKADLESVLEFNPNDDAALNNIGPVYRQLGMTERAIECLKKLISIDNSLIGPYINLGFIYSKMDSIDYAIEYYNKALAIDPNEALVYSNRGYAYYQNKEYSKALDDINKSIYISHQFLCLS